MTKHLFHMNTEHVLGSLGLFLLLVVARLAKCCVDPQHTLAGRVSGCLARRAIDAVAVVGWLVDRLPAPALEQAPSSACDAANAWRPGLTRISDRHHRESENRRSRGKRRRPMPKLLLPQPERHESRAMA